ncbi:MAG TPA: VC0807 family protein [Pseudonocardiaceae bacterium]|jgi:hypothetical protein|nr:VC0807 family protein [Pseudonocardiaceae bacterium]
MTKTKEPAADLRLAEPRRTGDDLAPAETVPADLASAGAAPASKRKVVIDLSLAIGLPTLGYYGAKAFGVNDYYALLIGTLIAGGRVVALAISSRRLDAFAAFMMLVYGVGLAAGLISGDARLMLAKDSLSDGLPGIAFLVSCVIGRPFLYYAIQGLAADDPARLTHLRRLWRTDSGFRRTMTQLSLVWGVVMLGFSLARLPLVYLLPINVMAGASNAAFYVMMVGLTIWSFRFGKRRGTRRGRLTRRLSPRRRAHRARRRSTRPARPAPHRPARSPARRVRRAQPPPQPESTWIR